MNDNEDNYLTNTSNIFANNSLRNIDKTISMESPMDKFGIGNKSTKQPNNLKEENFDTKPTMDFYKAYCEELENTINFLTEDMIKHLSEYHKTNDNL